jgi:TRAP-type C4-dicarboxylate transport system, small permease component
MRNFVRLIGVDLPAVLTGVIVLVVFADVVARNILHAPLPWAHELAVVLMSAVVWFGLVGVCMSDHMFGIVLVLDWLPEKGRRTAMVVADFMTVLISAAVVHAAYAQITTARFTIFLSLGWPKWIVALFLACGMALIIIVRGGDIITQLRGNKA